MEASIGSIITSLGPSGLLSLAVLLILVGKLIPRSTHEAIVNLLTDRLQKQDKQIDRLITGANTSADALEKIQRETDPDGVGDR